MRGTIIELNLFDKIKNKHGFIEGKDGNRYYCNQASFSSKTLIDDYFPGDEVSFAIEQTNGTCPRAIHIKLEKHPEIHDKVKFEQPGISRRMNIKKRQRIISNLILGNWRLLTSYLRFY